MVQEEGNIQTAGDDEESCISETRDSIASSSRDSANISMTETKENIEEPVIPDLGVELIETTIVSRDQSKSIFKQKRRNEPVQDETNL